MHRFYCPNADLSKKTIIISDNKELHHLINVLRLKKNDVINIFTGKGQEASGKIISLNKITAEIEVLEQKSVSMKNTSSIILACAIPKKSKFETIIEKCTELGVDEIIPVKTQRTEINVKDPGRLDKKISRYVTVAINASKQCKRQIIPKIHPITHFKTVFKILNEQTTIIIPSLAGKPKPLLKALNELQNPKQIVFFIGPEGDFTSEEYNFAEKHGAIPVSLGDTVLKVETAAIITIGCSSLYFHNN